MLSRGVLQRPDGARIPWEILGEGGGPRLVFGHGLMSNGLGAQALYQPVLDAGWTVLSMDQRGHGAATPLPQGPFAVETLGDDMLALLDEVQWETAWLGGGSMGAAAAMAAAAAATDRVRGLVLMAPAIGAVANPALAPFADLGDVFARDGLDAGIERYCAILRASGATEDAVAAGTELLRLQPASSWAAALRGVPRWSMERHLAAIADLDVPSLVIAWPGDDVHPVAVAEELVARLHDARLQVIDTMAEPADLFRVMLTMLAAPSSSSGTAASGVGSR